PAIHDPASDRAALAVVVLEDGRGDAGGVAAGGGLEAVVAFGDVPAVVLAAPAGGEADVDLLPLALADVGDHEVAGPAVEGEPPRVAQAVGPDLAAGPGGAGEGVVGGNGVRGSPVHVDAQHLAEQGPEVLAVAERIAAAAAVAEADVQHPVATEGEATPVVVGEGLRDEEHLALAPGIGGIGSRRGVELRDVGVAVAIGVVHEEAAVLGVAGVEGEAEQAALTAGRDPSRDVEE